MNASVPVIVACLKWVSHPGEPHDERYAGMSAADQSALEFALAQAEALGTGVTAITVGPVGADKVLRDALASGARWAIRLHTTRPMRSHDVAAAIGAAVPDAKWVWCGDYSLDRGTGSVPAFLAGYLDAQQALGVIAIERRDIVEGAGDGVGDVVNATRRLDGGRRELLTLNAPAVISVEGATAHLRRAGLAAVRAAGQAQIDVIRLTENGQLDDAVVNPYRPRARALAAPSGEHSLDRLRALTDSGSAKPARGELVELSPDRAAARIIDALRDWGYLDPASP